MFDRWSVVLFSIVDACALLVLRRSLIVGFGFAVGTTGRSLPGIQLCNVLMLVVVVVSVVP